MQINIKKFTDMVISSFESDSLQRITLSNNENKTDTLNKIIIRAVIVKNSKQMSFVYRHKTKDITKNYDLLPSVEKISQHVSSFQNATLFTTENDVYLYRSGNKTKMRIKPPTMTSSSSQDHNRKKKHLITTDNNIYLQQLGILTSNGEVKSTMSNKYRQICKFTEIIDSTLKDWNKSEPISLVDMGAGKGYLTFAIYDHIFNHITNKCNVLGIERRTDLVNQSNQIAKNVGFANLSFMLGDIHSACFDSANVLVALHACDTATDDAIVRGINSNMKIIICAPCCHKYLRNHMTPVQELESILRHGILKERQAEILTDGIRAIILEACGYSTKVFEFVAKSHTAKNIMIVAKKRSVHNKHITEQWLQHLNEIKRLYGIEEYYLETRLKDFFTQESLRGI